MSDIKQSIDSDERRGHTRKRVTVKVGLRSEHGFWAGFTEDISEGGIFVATSAPFELGEKVTVNLMLGKQLGQVPVRCVVCWIRPDTGGGLPPGMGLRFIDLDGDAAEQVRKYVESGRLEILFWED
ncbi:MAG: PilZ domain-containing protein [Myxococcota bacterium]|jgi:type IV pilus assembly protein PilZ|nr:PilZ domain-containing protein [Myxococcota bacterium]